MVGWSGRDRLVLALVVTVGVCMFGLFPLRTEWLNTCRSTPGAGGACDAQVLIPDELPWPYGGAELYDALAAASPLGRRVYAWSEVTLDAVFPLAYAGLAVLVLLGVWQPPAGFRYRAWCTAALATPVLTAVADGIENLCLWRAALHPVWAAGAPRASLTLPTSFESLAVWASMAGGMKWCGLYVTCGLLVLGLVASGRLGRISSLLWLARVPFGMLLGLLLLARLGTGAAAAGTLSNLLVSESFGGLLGVAFVAAYTAALAGFNLMLVWELGALRTGAVLPQRPAPLAGLPPGSAQQGRWFLPFALPLIFLCAARTALEPTARLPLIQVVSAPLLGVGLCWAALEIIEWVRRRLMGRWSGMWSALARLARLAGPGYSEADRDVLRPGHGLATAAVLVGLAVYFAGQWGFEPRHSWLDQRSVPALVYGLVVAAVSMSLLSGAAFLLDRWRVPLLGGVLAVLLVASLSADGHVFRARWREQALPEVTQAAEARVGPQPPPYVVVVTASGGGIQAAAWTARVLTGLQALKSDQGSDLGLELARRTVLISTTSGGTVGAYFFLAAFGEQGVVAGGRLAGVVAAASASALETTAWGVAYPDLQRVFGFWGGSPRDRGWAMERGWLAARREAGLGEGDEEPWSAWVEATRAGRLPAVVFNAVRVDDGLPLRLSTVGGERWTSLQYGQRRERFLDFDTVTAARLSATFPYISPLPRPTVCDAREPSTCWVAGDGGYLDNDGTLAALDWLYDFLGMSWPRPLRVLWVQIEAFPKEPSRSAPLAAGWTLSLGGPAQALLHVRSNGQPFRRDRELQLVRRIYEARQENKLDLQVVTLRPPPPPWAHPRQPPLSWQFNARDKARIEADWRVVEKGPQVECLRDFVRRAHEGRPNTDAQRPQGRAGVNPARLFERGAPAASAAPE